MTRSVPPGHPPHAKRGPGRPFLQYGEFPAVKRVPPGQKRVPQSKNGSLFDPFWDPFWTPFGTPFPSLVGSQRGGSKKGSKMGHFLTHFSVPDPVLDPWGDRFQRETLSKKVFRDPFFAKSGGALQKRVKNLSTFPYPKCLPPPGF